MKMRTMENGQAYDFDASLFVIKHMKSLLEAVF